MKEKWVSKKKKIRTKLKQPQVVHWVEGDKVNMKNLKKFQQYWEAKWENFTLI